MEANRIKILAEALARIPDKSEHKDTTTKAWKEDLVHLIDLHSIKSVLEIGSSRGHTLHVIYPFVEKLTGVELSKNRISDAKLLNMENTNITYFTDDVYNSDWNKYGYHDLVIIDCRHGFSWVVSDITNAIKIIKPKFIAFDDYGLLSDVKKAVDSFIKSERLKVIADLGAKPGTILEGVSKPIPLDGPEGLFCEVNYY